MDQFEFELRYKAYSGLSHKFDIARNADFLINLVCISDQGIPTKKIQEISPDELKTLTLETYTVYKKNILQTEGKREIGFGTIQIYIDRLEYELKVIKEMGFHSYMLVVSDYVTQARKMGIVVGPGRGSGAGSLLAWCIGITDVDPLAYDLLFERFLNPARISMPDFDIDFEDTLRDKVIDYITDKYGASNVCAIGTFMTMATKAAFKDVARAIGIAFDRSNAISNLFPVQGSVLSVLESSDPAFAELRSMYVHDEIFQRAIRLSSKLEGNLRQLGVHACGIIIAPAPVTSYTSLQPIDEIAAIQVSHSDGHVLEDIGLLKMDFLGLRNLSVVKNCIKIIKARWENRKNYAGEIIPKMFSDFLETMQFYPPLNDQKTFVDVFQKGDTTGVFQFEGGGIRKFLVELKPTDINDLFAMNALYRPGPMEFIPIYIRRKHGQEKVLYMLPELETILRDKYGQEVVIAEAKKLTEDLGPIMNITYGIAVYQEQLMFLVQRMAGFSLPDADLLRRGIGKKIKEVIEKLKKEFIDKSGQYRQYKPETAQIIYEKMIEPAASYSFNKSHSVCYAYIAYQTGYLKAHYPLEFYAALMRSVEEDTDKLWLFIEEVHTHGISVLCPHINYSYNHIAAIDDSVRLGFLSVKGLGYTVGETIEQERKTAGTFASLEDFCTRCKTIINKKTLESLAQSGSLDGLCDRMTVLANVQQILDWVSTLNNQAGDGLFGFAMVDTKITFKNPHQTSYYQSLMMDFKMYKTFVAEHPFDGLYPYLKRRNFISQLKGNDTFGPFLITCLVKGITRAKKKGFFLLLEDATESMEVFVTDKLDLELFDVLIISGIKTKYIGMDEIVKIPWEQLVAKAKAADKYDPRWTVAKVKAERGLKDNQYISHDDGTTAVGEFPSLDDVLVSSHMQGDSPILTEYMLPLSEEEFL